MTQETTDIVARLREETNGGRLLRWCPPQLANEAAAEIERLRAVIRVNALRWNPALSHEQIDEVIHGKRP